MKNNSRPLSAAERQHRYRQRQKLGLRMFSVELDDDDIARLIDNGWLEEPEGLNCDCVANAIENLVESLGKPMSAFPTITSALPPIADIIQGWCFVRL